MAIEAPLRVKRTLQDRVVTEENRCKGAHKIAENSLEGGGRLLRSWSKEANGEILLLSCEKFIVV
jgi:hypothetical protein